MLGGRNHLRRKLLLPTCSHSNVQTPFSEGLPIRHIGVELAEDLNILRSGDETVCLLHSTVDAAWGQAWKPDATILIGALSSFLAPVQIRKHLPHHGTDNCPVVRCVLQAKYRDSTFFKPYSCLLSPPIPTLSSGLGVQLNILNPDFLCHSFAHVIDCKRCHCSGCHSFHLNSSLACAPSFCRNVHCERCWIQCEFYCNPTPN